MKEFKLRKWRTSISDKRLALGKGKSDFEVELS